MSINVYGLENCFQSSCSDQNSVDTYTGYSSNFPSYNLYNPFTCYFQDSDFTPVGADFDNDGVSEIVIVDNTYLKIYNTLCELEFTIDVGLSIKAMPNIMNYNANAEQEIHVLTNETLEAYEFDGSSYTLINTVDTLSEGDALTCMRIPNDETCFIFEEGSKTVQVYEYSVNIIYDSLNVLSYPFRSFGDFSGVTNSRTGANDVTSFLAPICSQYSSGTTYCDMLEYDGTITTTTNSLNYGLVINGILQQDAFIAKLGSTFRLFVSEILSTTSTNKLGYRIQSLNGANIVNIDSTIVNPIISNWMVGDYNKDGSNEACIIGLLNNTETNNMYISCYDFTGTRFLYENITNKISPLSSPPLNGVIMADFNKSFGTLGFMLYDGIYYLDGSNFTKYVDTGISYNGKSMLIKGNLDGEPAGVFVSGTSSFIISNNNVSTTCGDGICSGFENPLTCAIDCGLNSTGQINYTGDICDTDSQCYSGRCELGECALALSGESCTQNNQCASNECNNGKCTNEGLITLIKNAIGTLFGDDPASLLFVSLVIIAFIVIIVQVGTGSVVISSIVGFFCFIVCVAIGMISLWVLLIMMLILLIVTALLFFSKSQQL